MKLLLLIPTLLAAPQVNFSVGVTGMHIKAECRAASVTREGKKLIGLVELDSCDTGIDLRNRHMKEDLGVAKNPVAKLVVEGAKAELTVNGITRPVSVDQDERGVRFELKLSDFAVPRRTYMGIGVKDEAKVEALF